jgi:hypothetical protein
VSASAAAPRRAAERDIDEKDEYPWAASSARHSTTLPTVASASPNVRHRASVCGRTVVGALLAPVCAGGNPSTTAGNALLTAAAGSDARSTTGGICSSGACAGPSAPAGRASWGLPATCMAVGCAAAGWWRRRLGAIPARTALGSSSARELKGRLSACRALSPTYLHVPRGMPFSAAAAPPCSTCTPTRCSALSVWASLLQPRAAAALVVIAPLDRSLQLRRGHARASERPARDSGRVRR